MFGKIVYQIILAYLAQTNGWWSNNLFLVFGKLAS